MTCAWLLHPINDVKLVHRMACSLLHTLAIVKSAGCLKKQAMHTNCSACSQASERRTHCSSKPHCRLLVSPWATSGAKIVCHMYKRFAGNQCVRATLLMRHTTHYTCTRPTHGVQSMPHRRACNPTSISLLAASGNFRVGMYLLH